MSLFSKYQKAALATAQPEAFSDEYLIPMIVGEVGELIGQMAKARWHGTPSHELNRKLMLELGDVAWGLAIYLHTQNVTEVETSYPVTRSINTRAAYAMLESYSHSLFQRWSYNDGGLVAKVDQMWNFLYLFSVDLCGYQLEDVLDANIEKLASRAARGTLQGDGDDR